MFDRFLKYTSQTPHSNFQAPHAAVLASKAWVSEVNDAYLGPLHLDEIWMNDFTFAPTSFKKDLTIFKGKNPTYSTSGKEVL